MVDPVLQESHYIEADGGATLHLRRIYRDPEGMPVFMLHGAIEDGRIFYSGSGKGLAPYLARQGFDVYVADLRGKGESRPSVDRHARFGQTDAITRDIPAFLEGIARLRGPLPLQWVAHSWGGVLLSSYLARFPEECGRVRSLVYFGTKRSVRVRNLQRFLKVELVWKGLCPLLARLVGYLPARAIGIGSDNESAPFLAQCNAWVKAGPWVDPADGFDYGRAIREVRLPPAWYIAAGNDRCLGHPADVRDFMLEAGGQERRYTLLSRENGNRRDYDHINMLTHGDAVADHFPQVAAWLRQHGGMGKTQGGYHG